jgi:MarR family transcriptional regulator, transcriptional regulator for hemolysin
MDDEPLTRQVVMTAKTIKALFEDALAEEGATLATWVVLNGVERGRWASQSGLAKELRIEGATVTRHLDRLEREGLVERARDPEDRRQISVALTPAGKALHRRLRSVARRLDDRVCEGLSERDRSDLQRVLERIRANVGGEAWAREPTSASRS